MVDEDWRQRPPPSPVQAEDCSGAASTPEWVEVAAGQHRQAAEREHRPQEAAPMQPLQARPDLGHADGWFVALAAHWLSGFCRNGDDPRLQRARVDRHQSDVYENEGNDAEHDGEMNTAGYRIATEQSASQPSCTSFQMARPVSTCRMIHDDDAGVKHALHGIGAPCDA